MASKPSQGKGGWNRTSAVRRQSGANALSRTVSSLGLIGALGWLLIGIGLVLLSVGYFRVSDNPDPSFQLRVMSAQTAGGLFCAAAGGILVVSRHYQSFAHEYRTFRAERAGAGPLPDLAVEETGGRSSSGFPSSRNGSARRAGGAR